MAPRMPDNPSPELVQAQKKMEGLTAETRAGLREWSKALRVQRSAIIKRIRSQGVDAPASPAEHEAVAGSERIRDSLLSIRAGRALVTEELVRLRHAHKAARLGAKGQARTAPEGPQQLSNTDRRRLEKAVDRFTKKWIKEDAEKKRKRAAKAGRRTKARRGMQALDEAVRSAVRKDELRFDRGMLKINMESEKKVEAVKLKMAESGRSPAKQRKKNMLRRELRKLATQRKRIEERLAKIANNN